RVKGGIAVPRELIALRRSLEVIPKLREVLESANSIDWLKDELKPCPEVVDLISQAIVESPGSLDEGGVVRQGFSEELDNLRQTSKNAKQYLADLERKEREKTGIKSLKVGFNKVFGYYIEVSKPNLPQVPQDYIRKQTLVGGERFFTPELKEYESLILNAQDRIGELEAQLFRQVCNQVGARLERISASSLALADIDVFSSLAEVAVRYSYVRPELTPGKEIAISEGRHPV
ncbi:unnamed protein product, partial [marine sediment metagenome]